MDRQSGGVQGAACWRAHAPVGVDVAADDEVSLVLVQQPLQLLPAPHTHNATAMPGRIQPLARMQRYRCVGSRAFMAPAAGLAGWLAGWLARKQACTEGECCAAAAGFHKKHRAASSEQQAEGGGQRPPQVVSHDAVGLVRVYHIPAAATRNMQQATARSRQKSAGVHDQPIRLLRIGIA